MTFTNENADALAASIQGLNAFTFFAGERFQSHHKTHQLHRNQSDHANWNILAIKK